MGGVRARRLLQIGFLGLSACARHDPSGEEVRKAVSTCGLTIDHIQHTYDRDYAGLWIIVKKVPETDFRRKAYCIRWIFSLKRIDADVISNGGEPTARLIPIKPYSN